MKEREARLKRKLLLGLLACTCLGAATAAALPASAAAADNRLQMEVRYFIPQVDATAKSDKIHIVNESGSEVNFKDTLGVDNKAVPEVRASWKDWTFDYVNLHQSGDRVLDNAIIYEGDIFPAGGEPTHTKLNVDYFALNWKHNLHTASNYQAYWNAGLKVIRIDTSVSGAGQSSGKTFTGGIPTVGLGVSAYLDESKRLSLNGEVSGMTLGGRGHVLDLEMGLKYQPSRQFNLALGYRLLDAKLDRDDERASYKAYGPFIGLGVNF